MKIALVQMRNEGTNVDASDYCLTISSEVVKAFRKACKDNNVFAVPNIYLKDNEKCYDASLLIDKAGNIQEIQKMVR